VAKILVADDNSNIQKMVGLALKDQGIDVVAVGNGEAAVRKISDIRPDLVLADVFMPVRNGYEVCQYVKQDPSLAHIPVILLVGAFDPLDEQEAQRVGADGVLKKPFVPPDPLIAMVKAALTRAGVSYSSEKTLGDKAAKTSERKGADLLMPQPVPVPVPVPVVMAPPVLPPESISMEDMDGLVEEVSLVPPPVKMDGEAPLAFGNLMDSGSTVEEDPGFMPAAHPELTAVRDWRSAEEDKDVPEEEEEEEKPKASWRRDAADEEEVAAEGVTGAVPDWRDTTFNEPPVRKSAREDWGGGAPEVAPVISEAASTREIAPAVLREAASTVTTIDSGSAATDRLPQMPAFSADAWAHAISAGESEGAGAAAHLATKNGIHTLTEEHAPSALTELPAASLLAVEHDAVATALDRFAVAQDAQSEVVATPAPTSAWEQQAMKASLLSATWDAPAAEAKPAQVAPIESVPVAVAPNEVAAIEAAPLDVAPVEAAPTEAAVSTDTPYEAPREITAPETTHFVASVTAAAETAAVEEPSSAIIESAREILSEASAEGTSGAYAAAEALLERAGGEAGDVTHSAYSPEPSIETPNAEIAPAAIEALGVEPAVSAEIAAVLPELHAATETAVYEAAAWNRAILKNAPELPTHVQEEAVRAPAEVTSMPEQAPAAPEAVPEAAPAESIAAESASARVAQTVAEPAAENLSENSSPAQVAAGENKRATEDLVARVLASLSPEVMQAVTRELLKPVVEAMVREELNKKK
jgi:CheY-like chemotaxis protein